MPGYYYDFHGNYTDDPDNQPTEDKSLSDLLEIQDPLNKNQPVEGVISYNAHSGVLTKFRMFKGEVLKDNDGREVTEKAHRRHNMPQFKVVRKEAASEQAKAAPNKPSLDAKPNAEPKPQPGEIVSARAWFKHTVQVQPEVDAVNSTGGVDITYPATSKTLRCFVDPARAVEFIKFREKLIARTHHVYFLADPGIDETDSLVFNGRRLFIASTINFCEKSRLWRVDCGENTQGPWKEPS